VFRQIVRIFYSKIYHSSLSRPSAFLFYAGCNEELLNPEKKLAQIRLVVSGKNENAPLIPKNNVTEPKARPL